MNVGHAKGMRVLLARIINSEHIISALPGQTPGSRDNANVRMSQLYFSTRKNERYAKPNILIISIRVNCFRWGGCSSLDGNYPNTYVVYRTHSLAEGSAKLFVRYVLKL